MSSQLPVDWKYLPMEAIAEKKYAAIVDGPFGSNLKTSDYVPLGIPVLQGKNITNDRFKWFDIRFISPEKAQDIIRSSVKVGDILLVKIGSVGYSAVVDDLGDYDFAIIPANLMKVSLDENICSSSYIHHYLTSPTGKQRLVDAASSTAQPALSLSILKKYRVPLPPLPEQQKIAAILTSVDDVIESTQAQINKLKDLKTGMMQELLTKGIGHTEFKDSSVGRIPKEWEVVKLQSCISNICSGWSPVCDSRVRTGDEWGILKTTAVVWSGYAPNENKVLADHHEFVENAIVRRGDILITRKGPRERVGVCVYVNDTPDRLMVPDTVFRLIVGNSSSLSAEFISVALSSEAVQLDWNRKKVGLAEAQVNINHQTFNSTFIVAPSKDEQNKICSALKEIQKYINEKQEKLNIYSSLKKALMQDLLTGKVRVKVN